MNMEQLHEFARLRRAKDDIEASLKEVKMRLGELEEALIPQFIADGLRSTAVDSHTITLKPDIYVSVREDQHDAVVHDLKEHELEQYVKETFSISSITAWVRDVAVDVQAACKREGRIYDEAAVAAALPGNLAQALKISFIFHLNSRKRST